MLDKGMLTTVFDYNAATNARLLGLAAHLTDEQLDAPTGYSAGSLRRTFHHLLVTEWWWRGDCQGDEATTEPIDSTATIAALQSFQHEEHARARAFLSGLGETDSTTSVTVYAKDGRAFSFAVWQGLTHLLYHSAQHRSEIAMWLTQYGQSPGNIDFYNFVAAR